MCNDPPPKPYWRPGITVRDMDPDEYKRLAISKKPFHDTSNDYAIVYPAQVQQSPFRVEYKTTTYELPRLHVRVELGLLSACHRIRELSVPILYGENRIRLDLREGVIPFFRNRSHLTRQIIKDLHLEWFNIDGASIATSFRVWIANFAYIREHLTGLRKLEINVFDNSKNREDRLANLDLGLTDMDSDKPQLAWVRPLVQLRGLQRFRISFHDALSWEDPGHLEALFQNYIAGKVCQ